ncbi:MAG: DNA mismatch repair endonuclease MutL, partial [Pseudomonadota bacterium]
MSLDEPHIQSDRRQIRLLDPAAANRIAAGEVVERPASAVKELVENALDAGASRIDITLADAGRTLIRVADDGHGIPADELGLAFERHATSKIDGSNLLAIRSFGFRGEALASLGAVAEVRLRARGTGAGAAAERTCRHGHLGPLIPAARGRGTEITVTGLFHATPARLKFLKSDRAELQAITDTVRRLAIAAPGVAFTLTDQGGGRTLLRLDPETGADAFGARLASVFGPAFVAEAVPIAAEREGVRLSGFAGLPTAARGAPSHQLFYVNARPLRDRLLHGALRAAYGDLIPRGRHPVAALFLTCPVEAVDVNVHPTKAEVRFRDASLVRGLVIAGLRHALAEGGLRTARTLSLAALGPAPTPPAAPIYQMDRTPPRQIGFAETTPADAWRSGKIAEPVTGLDAGRASPDPGADEAARRVSEDAPPPGMLGTARAQLFDTYILAQTETQLLLVDAHAAHERLVYERLKSRLSEANVPTQALLLPAIVDLSPDRRDRLLAEAPALARAGLVIEGFGPGAIAVRETPALLGNPDAAALLCDVADALETEPGAELVGRRLQAVLSSMACHGSVRAGRRLTSD